MRICPRGLFPSGAYLSEVGRCRPPLCCGVFISLARPPRGCGGLLGDF